MPCFKGTVEVHEVVEGHLYEMLVVGRVHASIKTLREGQVYGCSRPGAVAVHCTLHGGATNHWYKVTKGAPSIAKLR